VFSMRRIHCSVNFSFCKHYLQNQTWVSKDFNILRLSNLSMYHHNSIPGVVKMVLLYTNGFEYVLLYTKSHFFPIVVRPGKISREITAPEMAKEIGITIRSVERNLEKLKKLGLLKRIGPSCRH